MRIRLDIDDDVLQAAKELSRRDQISIGQAISALARSALATSHATRPVPEPDPVHGFRAFAPRGGVVTNELVDSLRELTG